MSCITPLQSFNFEGSEIRVFGDAVNPLFIASDICKALGIKNVTQALAVLAPFEKTTVQIDIPNPKANDPMLKIGSIRKEVNAVTESGLYTLALRCRDAVVEGTAPYRFRVKVTNEILPAIRRTGQYTAQPVVEKKIVKHFMPVYRCPFPVSYFQYHQLRALIKARKFDLGVTFQSIYVAFYKHFGIANMTEMPACKFDEAVEWLYTYGMNGRPIHVPAQVSSEPPKRPIINYADRPDVLPPPPPAHLLREEQRRVGKLGELADDALFPPPIPDEETPAQPALPDGSVVLSRLEAEQIQNFVFCWRYLFRNQLEAFGTMLRASGSPMADRFYEACHDLNLALIEHTLAEHGLSVKDMPAYKALIGKL